MIRVIPGRWTNGKKMENWTLSVRGGNRSEKIELGARMIKKKENYEREKGKDKGKRNLIKKSS